MKDIIIGKRKIGKKNPTYFIADIAANHDGDLKKAKHLIYLAAKSGADAAKFQNFKAPKIVSDYGFTHLGKKLSHQAKWRKSVYQVYQEASISEDWTKELRDTCLDAGIDYFTSPYDFDSVDQVDPYVQMYKIGSGDITWTEIISYISQKRKPVLIATGASTLDDVKRAMRCIQKFTNKIVLMQCNTNYTASLSNFSYINLNVLKTYQKLYPEVILGLSDHTPGHTTVLGAVTLGARVIEKHFTDNNEHPGPDHKFSMNPISWREMVDRTRELEAALGDGIKRIEINEQETAVLQRRSLRATADLKKGEILKKSDLVVLRPIPKDGIPPYELEKVIGKRLKKNLIKGAHLTLKHI